LRYLAYIWGKYKLNPMATIKSKLDSALNEKDVENIYRDELLSIVKGAEITSPLGGDSLLEFLNKEVSSLRLLLEFKFDDDFKKKINQCSVLVQCLYYIKNTRMLEPNFQTLFLLVTKTNALHFTQTQF